MFEVPDAKRVKRSDFFNQNEDGDSTPLLDVANGSDEDEIKERAVDYGFDYEFVPPSAPQKQPKDLSDERDDQSYEFRLFAPATKSAVPKSASSKETSTKASIAPRITLLRSPSPSWNPLTQNGRLLRPRPESHYFANLTPELQSQFYSSAISTVAILSLAQTPWPGTSLSWRVKQVPASSTSTKSTTLAKPTQDPAKPNTRTKPNKKRRILLRRRLAARLMTTTKSKSKPAPKPITRSETGEILDLLPEEREKRTARNREKKLKKRQRERERKAALAESGGWDREESIKGDVPGEGTDDGDGRARDRAGSGDGMKPENGAADLK